MSNISGQECILPKFAINIADEDSIEIFQEGKAKLPINEDFSLAHDNYLKTLGFNILRETKRMPDAYRMLLPNEGGWSVQECNILSAVVSGDDMLELYFRYSLCYKKQIRAGFILPWYDHIDEEWKGYNVIIPLPRFAKQIWGDDDGDLKRSKRSFRILDRMKLKTFYIPQFSLRRSSIEEADKAAKEMSLQFISMIKSKIPDIMNPFLYWDESVTIHDFVEVKE
jgi:hypothetical protein